MQKQSNQQQTVYVKKKKGKPPNNHPQNSTPTNTHQPDGLTVQNQRTSTNQSKANYAPHENQSSNYDQQMGSHNSLSDQQTDSSRGAMQARIGRGAPGGTRGLRGMRGTNERGGRGHQYFHYDAGVNEEANAWQGSERRVNYGQSQQLYGVEEQDYGQSQGTPRRGQIGKQRGGFQGQRGSQTGRGRMGFKQAMAAQGQFQRGGNNGGQRGRGGGYGRGTTHQGGSNTERSLRTGNQGYGGHYRDEHEERHGYFYPEYPDDPRAGQARGGFHDGVGLQGNSSQRGGRGSGQSTQFNQQLRGRGRGMYSDYQRRPQGMQQKPQSARVQSGRSGFYETPSSHDVEKQQIEELYGLRVTQNKEPMPLLTVYKDFVKPDFFQGPKFNFLKESTFGSAPKHVRKQQEAEARQAFDFVQEMATGMDDKEDSNSAGHSPLTLQKFESAEFDEECARFKQRHKENREPYSKRHTEQAFDAGRERNTGNQFWKQGKGRQDHRAQELAAKQRRQQSKKEQGLSQKDQNESDEVQSNNETSEKKKPGEQIHANEGTSAYRGKFESHLIDKNQIEAGKAKGKYFEGIMRVNQSNRRRAFVSVNGFDIDVMLDGLFAQNCALDGDRVLIEMLPVMRWQEYQQSRSAELLGQACEATSPQTGVVKSHSSEHNEIPTSPAKEEQNPLNNSQEQRDASPRNGQGDPAEYRAVHREWIKQKRQDSGLKHDQNSSSNEEGEDQDPFPDMQMVAEVGDEEAKQDEEPQPSYALRMQFFEGHEDYEADEFEGEELMSEGYTDEDNSQRDRSNERRIQLQQEEETQEQHDREVGLKFKAQFKIDESSLESRVASINQIAQSLRPLGKVVAILHSPNQEKEQLVTLKAIDQEGLNFKELVKQQKRLRKKASESVHPSAQNQKVVGIYAIAVSQKLPWMQICTIPDEFLKDLKQKKNLGNRYYLAKISHWHRNDLRPTCQILSSIGEAGDLEAESMRLLRTFDIYTDPFENVSHTHQSQIKTYEQAYSGQILESLKPYIDKLDPETGEWPIPQNELTQRLDLRNKRIFTIDPITAKDLDDALSIEKIEDNIYEIGVHISDVSYFVTPGSELDKAAQLRCTSTYFVHKVYPMLPKLLCEKLCSLNPGVDRLVYSVFFRMERSTGNLVAGFKPVITRSVIRSCAKWNYKLVQDILDKKVTTADQLDTTNHPVNGVAFDDLVKDCNILNEIAQHRRQIRLKQGSFLLYNQEFVFRLDQETSMPESFHSSTMIESKNLIEEYMLLTNILVAEFVKQNCHGKTLLRAHQDIPSDKKAALNRFFQNIGLGDQIDLTNSTTLSYSLDSLSKQKDRGPFNVALQKFFGSLQAAQYVTISGTEMNNELRGRNDAISHYGLNFPLYTHFTSPIRRYADLLVHRQLTAALEHGQHANEAVMNTDYQQLAMLCSEKGLNAKRASWHCQRLFHCLLLKKRGIKVFECLIYDLDVQYIHIFLEDFNTHLKVRVEDDPRFDQIFFYEDSMKLIATIRKMEEDQDEYELKREDSSPLKSEQAREDQTHPRSVETSLDSNEFMTFRVLDTVKIKLSTTTEFPLDFRCEILFTPEDINEYNLRKQRQQAETESNGQSEPGLNQFECFAEDFNH